MPNWCENRISIYGPTPKIEEIFEKIKTPVEDGQEFNILENLYPTPQELNIGHAPMNNLTDQQIANKEKYGYPDWYQWRIDHWGTKWPDTDTGLNEAVMNNSDGYGILNFYFDSAWAPPIEAFHKISSDYPELIFCLYYQEPGMGFCGKNIWAKGECQEEESAELITDYFDEQYLYEFYNNEEENNFFKSQFFKNQGENNE
jgi:hypothetical protein